MKQILYIEDEAPVAEVIGRLYQTVRKRFHGEVAFETAASWQEGVQKIADDPPDVILLDLALGRGYGTHETISALAAVSEQWPPVMILTGNEYEPELRSRCILLGADDFMFKDAARRDPELLCERLYHCYLRRLKLNSIHEAGT